MPQQKLRRAARLAIHGYLFARRLSNAVAFRLDVAHSTVDDAFRPQNVQGAHPPLEPTADTAFQAISTIVEDGSPEVLSEVLQLYGAPPFTVLIHDQSEMTNPGACDVQAAALDVVGDVGRVAERVREAAEDGHIDLGEVTDIKARISAMLSAIGRLERRAEAAARSDS